jgi:hypothetical protein
MEKLYAISEGTKRQSGRPPARLAQQKGRAVGEPPGRRRRVHHAQADGAGEWRIARHSHVHGPAAAGSQGESVACDMPPMQKPTDAIAALSEVLDAVRVGDLTPPDAAKLAQLVHTWMETLERLTFERRLRKIEEQKGIAQADRGGEPDAKKDDAAAQPQ